MQNPLISVIIPTYNRAAFLERCLCSIKNVIVNDYPAIEIVVVDGGSTDGTAEVMKKYAATNVLHSSEKDSGAAEAINRGLMMAHGDLIRYFSDDDEMVPGETKHIVEYLCEHPEIEVLGGQATYFKDDGSQPIFQIYPELAVGEFTKANFPKEKKSITHETLFFRKSLFEHIGGYDTSYKFCFDVEMMWRIVASGRKIVITDKVLAKRLVQPSSNSQTHNEENFKEFVRVFFKYHAWRNIVKLYWYTKWKRIYMYPINLAERYLFRQRSY